MSIPDTDLTFGSLFDGIAGFPYAAAKLGIKTVWTSEIEPNCIEIFDTKGNEISDTARYTALGNSIAIPCAERVFAGIVAVDKEVRQDESTLSF